MRNLKLPALYRGHTLLTIEEDFDEAREIRRDSGRIISAASAIDQVIAEIIANTIFREVREHRELVLGSILSSDWCSFAAKRKLLKLAIETFSLIEGKKKNQLDKNLLNVMHYRNAFAHGTLGHNFNTLIQELHYFESKPQTATLNDVYFEKLQKVFLDAWETLQEIQKTIERNELKE